MKQINIFILLLFFTLQANSQTDFRKTYWGMTKDQVKKTENSEVIDEFERGIVYYGTAANLDCFIIYVFAYDTLVRAKYIIDVTHSNKNVYIIDFEDVKEILKKKYGNPDKERLNWLNHQYEDKKEDWGLAVSLGHLDYYAQWNTERTIIFTGLTGDNIEIEHSVQYASTKYKFLEERLNNEKQEDDF